MEIKLLAFKTSSLSFLELMGHMFFVFFFSLNFAHFNLGRRAVAFSALQKYC